MTNDDPRDPTIPELIKLGKSLHFPNRNVKHRRSLGKTASGARSATSSLPDTLSDLSSQDALVRAIGQRISSINFSILQTVNSAPTDILAAVEEMRQWISEEEIVRVVGYGRALLAAAIPANRLHHCGARVYIQHDRVPLPNSSRGGAILAASASGRTQAILDLLRRAKKLNPEIRIVGIADKSAPEFAQLCDIFVGIDLAYNPLLNPLHALADTGEYIISELLDAMVVAAARQAGLTEDDIRRGHEDLVDTGPHHQHES